MHHHRTASADAGPVLWESAGFTQISALPSPTPWGLLPSYWVREFFGLLVAWLFY